MTDLRQAHDAARAIAASALGRDPGPMTTAESSSHHVYISSDVVVKIIDATAHSRLNSDSATEAITGVAVTAHAPSRDAVLASLWIAITRSRPFGPVGGRPGQIRVDRGKEFLCGASDPSGRTGYPSA